MYVYVEYNKKIEIKVKENFKTEFKKFDKSNISYEFNYKIKNSYIIIFKAIGVERNFDE